MKVLYVSLVLTASLLLSMSISAQDGPPLYKGITVVSQEKSPSEMTFVLKKWDINFKLVLTKSPTAVNIRIFGPGKSLIGNGKIAKEGTKARKFVLQKSAKGIWSLWQFAFDQIGINNGNLFFYTRSNLTKSDVEEALINCRYCCWENHLEGTVYANEQYVEEQIKKGLPPKDWGWIYDLPPSSAQEAYTDCMDSCTEGGECADYEW